MTRLSIEELCGTDVSSRSCAAEVRRQVLAAVDQDQSKVEIDCSGVRTISDSFADELFGVLASEKGRDWFRDWIVVSHLGEFPRATVVEAIQNRTELV